MMNISTMKKQKWEIIEECDDYDILKIDSQIFVLENFKDEHHDISEHTAEEYENDIFNIDPRIFVVENFNFNFNT